MKATSFTTALVVAAAGANALNSSSTTYITEFYNSCDTTSAIPTMTATKLITYCPICEAGGMTTFEGGSFTIYETVYSAECSTGGLEDKTYTVTEPCPSSGLDRSADYVPQGFTTTTAPCGCAENTPVPITAPVPALASATALPTVSVIPTPASAGAPAKNAADTPAAAPAPTSPAGAPAAAPAGSSPPAPANAAAAGGAPAADSPGSPGSPGAPAAAPNTGSSSPAPANAASPEAQAAAPAGGSPSAPAAGGPSPAPDNAAAAGGAPGAGSPGSPADVPAEAPAAMYPTSPAGSPSAGVAPSSGSVTNSTVPFTGAAMHRIPSTMKATAGVIALIAAYTFVQ